MPHVSGRVVMNDESIMYQFSRSFCCFWLTIEESTAPLSPTVNEPNSVKMLGSSTPLRWQMFLICATISSVRYS